MYSSRDNKLEILAEMLKQPTVTKALVFENTKHGVDKIQKALKILGIESVAIHGNKNQNQRNRALESFKDGEVNVLIASNVAARGLDIPEVSHVFNFSLPQSPEDYVHRIGRTGRAGNTGFAFTFVEKK
jgi:ATP-dependent RNA helicase RhlE